MNELEQKIADEILSNIRSAGRDHRGEFIDQYRSFIQAVQTRIQTESQVIQNEFQRKELEFFVG